MFKSRVTALGSILFILLSLFFMGCSKDKEGKGSSEVKKKKIPLYTVHWEGKGYNDTITTVSYSPDGKMIASGADSSDKNLYISDAKTGKLIKTIKTPNKWHVVFSPDGKTLAGGSQGKVTIWETQTWTEVKTIPYVSTSLRSLTFSPDGKILITSGLDNRIILFDFQSGKKIKEINIQGYGWFTVFSPDGKYLATGGNSDVQVIEMSTGKVIVKLKGYKFDPMNTANNDTFDVVFTPDGNRLITGGADCSIRIWEIPSGKLIKKFEKLKSGTRELAITPDGKLLVSANWIDLNIYDLKVGRNIRVIPGIKQTAGMMISPNGKNIVTGGIDRVLRVWKLAN